MSLAEILTALRINNDQKNLYSRSISELIRWHGLQVTNMAGRMIKKPYKRPEDLLKFSWDDQNKKRRKIDPEKVPAFDAMKAVLNNAIPVKKDA